MAEEEAMDGEDTKKKSMLPIIIGVVVVLLGVGGYLGYTMFMAPEEKVSEEDKKMEEEKNADAQVKMVAMDPMIINLADTGGRRYLKITMEFEVVGAENEAEFKLKLPKIIDSILTLLSSKTFDDVYSVKGKYKLREEILVRVRNKMINKDSVRSVYFTSFVIQ
ncbi:MAG: flagellar basal body-associated FliL family protein [Nitrospinae bacterium]|nr:flagellar basal body-associated FliL family protein [Nitrospinota bacterium]